jgi:hypothetical protein
MNISNLSNQIEIAFWMGIVSLLRPRRLNHLASFALLALLCLAALLLTAFSFTYKGWAGRLLNSKSAPVRLTHNSGRPDNGQNNLLLILVDQADALEPGLQGVWMLIHDPTGRKVTFMPIYPAEAKLGQEVKQAVEMQRVNGLSTELQQALQKQGLWWDHYLVIDREALARLVQLAGGIDLGEGRLNGQQVTGLLPIANPDAQTSLALQARIAQGICQSFGTMIQKDHPEAIFELLIGKPMQPSVYSDLTHSDLSAFWIRSKKVGDIACEFPTLIGR